MYGVLSVGLEADEKDWQAALGNWEAAENWSPSGSPVADDNVTVVNAGFVELSGATEVPVLGDVEIRSGHLDQSNTDGPKSWWEIFGWWRWTDSLYCRC